MTLGTRLTGELTRLALCWRLVRRDGVALGFTSHDRPLLIDGLLHEARPGISPSAVVLGSGVAADDLEVAGALSAGALTRAELLAGRWDGARVELFLVDWQAPHAGRQSLAAGVLGDVAVGEAADAGFVAEVLGPGAAFGAAVVESCSPECRAELGDARCQISLRGRTHLTLVTAVDSGRMQLAGLEPDNLVHGQIEVLDGAAAGLSARLLAADTAWLIPDVELELAAGDRVLAREGCDKRFATCRDRFGNHLNFQGEPHVPGGDLLTRYQVG